MPIEYRCGDIFKAKAEVLVNPVNCLGVMGAGLAKQFKDKYPENFEIYKAACKDSLLTLGKPVLTGGVKNEPRILLFPTKYHWKEKSQEQTIEAGLQYFCEHYEFWNIQSIAFPKLGCGLGGLDWDTQVKHLMEEYLSSLPIKVLIYQSILSPTKPGSPARGPGKSK